MLSPWAKSLLLRCGLDKRPSATILPEVAMMEPYDQRQGEKVEDNVGPEVVEQEPAFQTHGLGAINGAHFPILLQLRNDEVVRDGPHDVGADEEDLRPEHASGVRLEHVWHVSDARPCSADLHVQHNDTSQQEEGQTEEADCDLLCLFDEVSHSLVPLVLETGLFWVLGLVDEFVEGHDRDAQDAKG